MIAIPELILQSFAKVWVTFTHNWPFLLVSVLISVALRLYMRPEKVSAFLTRYRRVGVVGATALAVTTPFCSCGTTAVILGMIASTIPWAPVVAFMVASPLTSPEELVYSAGLFGWPFAIAFFVSSILLGLLGGILAEFFESRGWLANQSRFAVQTAPTGLVMESNQPAAAQACACAPAPRPVYQAGQIGRTRPVRPVLVAGPALALETCCGTATAAPAPVTGCGCQSETVKSANCACGSSLAQSSLAEASLAEPCQACGAGDARSDSEPRKVTLRQWAEEFYRTGRQLLVMFLGFAFIGYLLNGLIPPEWIAAIFGKGNVYSVPLAATLGLPLYINTEAALPLIRALIDGGMSQGAALAFLITGSGTSFGAVAGALAIARWRVIALVVGTLWAGAIALGFGYDVLLAMHLF